MLSLAALVEVQRHNRYGEADKGPRAPNELFVRGKGARRRRVVEHSKKLKADPLEPASRPRSSFQPTFACPTPAYQTPPESTKKQIKNHKLDPTDDKEGTQTHPVESIVDRKSPFLTLSIRLHKNWPVVQQLCCTSVANSSY